MISEERRLKNNCKCLVTKEVMGDPQKMVIFSVSGGLPLYQSSQRSFEQKKENFAILAIRKPNQCSQHSNKEC